MAHSFTFLICSEPMKTGKVKKKDASLKKVLKFLGKILAVYPNYYLLRMDPCEITLNFHPIIIYYYNSS